MWDTLNPPVEEENLVGKWYGALYHESKKICFFIGKIVYQYLNDEDGSPVQLELDCLKRPVSSTATILEENLPHLKACGILLMHNIISGPLNGVPMKGNKWKFYEYPKAFKMYELVQNLSRGEEYKRSFPF